MCDQPKPSRWYRQIFENDNRILSCGRIMSMIAFLTACGLIFLYVLEMLCFIKLRNNDGEIIQLVQYLLAASFGGLILNKYMERPTVHDKTKPRQCKSEKQGAA